MKTKELNLAEILQGCPAGTTLYSPIFGKVSLCYVDRKLCNPICVVIRDADLVYFKNNGRYSDFEDTECMLFPSKENHDWSTFVVPKPKVEHFDPKALKPFDKVLVRDYSDSIWSISFFSNVVNEERFKYECMNGFWGYCIPYNDDTKHLIDTTDEAPEYYRY